MTVAGRVSVVIPVGPREPYLCRTVSDVLEQAAGDVEVIVVSDSPDADVLHSDPRVRVFPFMERRGMRACINDGAARATGEFLMKLDAHCSLAPGWDVDLKAWCDPDVLIVPTRHVLEVETWTVSPRDYNYDFLSCPYVKGTFSGGQTGGQTRGFNVERAAFQPVDETMCFQGSCWLTRAESFRRLGRLDQDRYGSVYGESVELALRQWLSGGRVLVHKGTSYAHWHKPRGMPSRFGHDDRRKTGEALIDFWMNDRWPGATRPFAWLIDHFGERLRSPNLFEDCKWPVDWQRLRPDNSSVSAGATLL